MTSFTLDPSKDKMLWPAHPSSYKMGAAIKTLSSVQKGNVNVSDKLSLLISDAPDEAKNMSQVNIIRASDNTVTHEDLFHVDKKISSNTEDLATCYVLGAAPVWQDSYEEIAGEESPHSQAPDIEKIH